MPRHQEPERPGAVHDLLEDYGAKKKQLKTPRLFSND
jgi:hypothetical protein